MMNKIIVVSVFAILSLSSIGQNFSKGEKIKAGGEVISMNMYSAPMFYDIDNDGLKDLVLGEFAGTIRVYRNVGSKGKPLFDKYTNLQAEGSDIEIPNY